jgi:hypothetical protein
MPTSDRYGFNVWPASAAGHQITEAVFGEILEVPGLEAICDCFQNLRDPAPEIPHQLIFPKAPRADHVGPMIMN